jgi:MHS family proline/betaine transporter-like MFS transporter
MGISSKPYMAEYVTAVALGATVEWYDFTIFSSLIAVISPLFFPSTSAIASAASFLVVFGIGFLARPIGGIVFGWIGDKVGRRAQFNGTIILFGVSTSLMGLLPTYASIGIWAGVLLVILRICQGLGLGGEFSGGGAFLAEYADDTNRGLITSFNSVTSTLAVVLGSVVILGLTGALGSNAFNQWGWRVAFLISALLTVVAVYFRFRARESPIFDGLKRERKVAKNPLAEGIKRNWKTMLIMIGYNAGPATTSTSTAGYGVMIFLTVVLKPPLSVWAATQLALVAFSVAALCYPLFGWLSDKFGSRKKVIMPSLIMGSIALYPLYLLVAYGSAIGSLPLQVIAVTLIAVSFASYNAPLTALWQEAFPHKVRATMVNLGYALALAIFGGFAPLIVTAISNAGGNWFFGLIWPTCVGIVAGIIGVIFVKETHNKLTVE